MVTYDSHKKSLQMSIRGHLDGTLATAILGEISLADVSEPERQRIIAVAKLVSSFVNGHDVTSKRKEVKGDTVVETESYLVSTAAKLKRSLNSESKAKPQPEVGVVILT